MLKYFGWIDGLRGLAAIFVVLNHGLRYAIPAKIDNGNLPTGYLGDLTGWMKHGHFAVTLFIAISGFCLAFSYREATLSSRGIINFYKKRALRILPTYYGALLVSLLLIYTLIGSGLENTAWGSCSEVSWKGIWSRLLMLQDLIANNQINPPFWSLAVEWRIYMVFPFILFLMQRTNYLFLSMMIVIFSHIMNVLDIPVLSTISIVYTGTFCLGVTAANIIMNEVKFDKVYKYLLALCCCLFLASIFIMGIVSYPENRDLWIIMDTFFGVSFFGFFVFLGLKKESILHRLLSVGGLKWLGKISFSLYLMHFPLQAVFWKYFIQPFSFGRDESLYMMLSLGTIWCIIVSYLFYLMFEKPIVVLLKKRKNLQRSSHV